MKQILLSLTVLSVCLSFGQSMIKGTISDANGKVPFSNVIIKHANKGVITDDKGHFTIEAKATDTLQISNLGYRTKEIIVGKQKDFDIVLNDYEELDTVMLYGFKGRKIICSTRCIFTSTICECFEDETKVETKVIDEAKKDIKLYPNPSKDGIFNLNTVDGFSEVTIIVADLTGRIIKEETRTKENITLRVDLSNQPSGIYIINLQSDGKTISSKKAIRI